MITLELQENHTDKLIQDRVTLPLRNKIEKINNWHFIVDRKPYLNFYFETNEMVWKPTQIINKN